MPGRFVVTRSDKGFRWNLLAANGRVIASSEHYATRQAARSGIESVKKNAAGAVLVEEQETEPVTEMDEAMQNLSRKRPVR